MERSAGIVLIKIINDEPHVLGLRIYNSFDLPKGKIEEGETELEAALRETYEEAGIKNIDFIWGMQSINLLNDNKKKNVTLFVGLALEEPIIQKNPQTGKYEHHSHKWLTLADAENSLHHYLRPAIVWVKSLFSI